MENLDRGLVALRSTTAEVFVSWRLLGTEPADTAFNLYRVAGGAAAVRLNIDPLVAGTNFLDATADTTLENAYFVRPVIAGAEQEASGMFRLPANAPVQPYLAVPLIVPAGGRTPDGVGYIYRANDCSVGDLDGDGDYEIVVKWDPTNSRDNSQSGHTGNVFLDAYQLDGTRLWRIDLGINIRAGAHYTQFLVYDFDGDGRAEIACRTAEGSQDGAGNFVADPAKFAGTLPPIEHNADRRNSDGYILTGPEFLTVFDGLTGEELASTPYEPQRVPGTYFPTPAQIDAIWGDDYGNRIDRFLACVAYLDGRQPSLVMCRGYYTGRNGGPGRTVLAAYDWRNGQLTSRWVFDTNSGDPGDFAYRGQGAHSLTVGDVDGDGRDEIIYGACAIDDDGSGIYNTALGHGDALHLSDMDPDRPGLEVWMVHEDPGSYGPAGLELRDAADGALLYGVDGQNSDVGRGVAFDIDPRHPGYEMWGARGGLYNAQGVQISPSRPGSMNFAIWWDGDLLREICDGGNNDGGSGSSPFIDKWNWTTGSTTRLLSATGCHVNNFTKANPCLTGDIVGDWREELVLRTADSSELRIYTTTIPTTHRIPTLMHDPTYRLAIAWQNVGYNQPPHPGFHLGDGMGGVPHFDIVPAATFSPPSTASAIVNLSVRTLGGVGAETMILGFVVHGTGEQRLLVRGVGPTLSDQGVISPMPNPQLDLYEKVSQAGGGQTDVHRGNNLDWSAAANAAAIADAALDLNAFPLPDPGLDAAMLVELPVGTFTAHVHPENGTPAGIALAELYTAGSTGTTRLVNASARAQVAPGEQTLIAGFVIHGGAPKTVLLRAVGPGLGGFGVDNLLADPELTLFRLNADGTTWSIVATNADWSHVSGATLATFARLGAFDVPVGSKDAALLLRLSPGVYTAHASGLGGSSGVALIEVYDADVN